MVPSVTIAINSYADRFSAYMKKIGLVFVSIATVPSVSTILF